jgi:hypothetical protein
MLSWQEVSQAFGSSPRYWIATTDADGAPHVVQQWGAWVEDRLFFEGGSTTRWARNLARDPRVAVSAETGRFAIMIEGHAENLSSPDEELARAIIRAYAAKPYGYEPDPVNWKDGGLIAVRPRKAFAWRYDDFPSTATRFTFSPASAAPSRERDSADGSTRSRRARGERTRA